MCPELVVLVEPKFSVHAASQPLSWAATRAVGSFTGPPVETGATLPYREPSAACTPTASISRSITSGAREPNSQLQALTQAELETSAPQLMLPDHTSSQAQQASMALNQSSAVQFPPSLAPVLAPSSPPEGLHTTSSGAAQPSTGAVTMSKPAVNISSWGPVTSYAQLLMPTQSLTLTGTWTSTCYATCLEKVASQQLVKAINHTLTATYT